MIIIEDILMALSAIRANRTRSVLTMLGIIIGISSVIAITSIGSSIKEAMQKQYESLGINYMDIYPNYAVQDIFYYEDLFTEEDVDAFRDRFDEVLYAAPYESTVSEMYQNGNRYMLAIDGVGADYNHFNTRFSVIEGRMINQSDVDRRKANIVIDEKLAEKLYGTTHAVGRTLTTEIFSEMMEFHVVGIIRQETTFLANLEFGEPYYDCYLPYSIMMELDTGVTYYIEIYADPAADSETMQENFCTWLSRYKGHVDNLYICESAESESQMLNTIIDLVSAAIAAIAAISLMVGGIGIMNIMLVSVTERTREIGIRKSLGAQTRDILIQFLIESVVLSAIGGVIGTLFGAGLGKIAALIAGMDLVVSRNSVILAVSFAAATGLFFGIRPARKAAEMDPIEALRYE